MKRIMLFMFAAVLCCGIQSLSAVDSAKKVVDTKEKVDINLCPISPSSASGLLKTAFSNLVCKESSISSKVTGNDSCKTFCDNLASGSTTPVSDVNQCISFIASVPGAGSALVSFFSKGCNYLCSGGGSVSGCNTCSDDTSRKVCGLLCCSLDPSQVSSCMSNNGDSCSKYTGSTDKLGVDEI